MITISYAGNDGLLQVQMTMAIALPPPRTLVELLWPSVPSTAHKTPMHNTNTRALSHTFWETGNVLTQHLLTRCHQTRKNPDLALKMKVVDWSHLCQFVAVLVVVVGKKSRFLTLSLTERVSYRSAVRPGRERAAVECRVRPVPELRVSALVAWRLTVCSSKGARHLPCNLMKPRSTER